MIFGYALRPRIIKLPIIIVRGGWSLEKFELLFIGLLGVMDNYEVLRLKRDLLVKSWKMIKFVGFRLMIDKE